MNRIKYFRIQSGMSISQVAQKIGVTSAAVCDWESGTKFPNRFRLMRLSRLFGVHFDDLVDPDPVIFSEEGRQS